MIVQDLGRGCRASSKVTRSICNHWSKPLPIDSSRLSPVECWYSKDPLWHDLRVAGLDRRDGPHPVRFQEMNLDQLWLDDQSGFAMLQPRLVQLHRVSVLFQDAGRRLDDIKRLRPGPLATREFHLSPHADARIGRADRGWLRAGRRFSSKPAKHRLSSRQQRLKVRESGSVEFAAQCPLHKRERPIRGDSRGSGFLAAFRPFPCAGFSHSAWYRPSGRFSVSSTRVPSWM